MPPGELETSFSSLRWGLRYSAVEGFVCLEQIAGGGRVLLRTGAREWWCKSPSGVAWEAFPTATGQTYGTREEAEQVIANLRR